MKYFYLLNPFAAIVLNSAANVAAQSNGGFLCATDTPERFAFDSCISKVEEKTITGCVQDNPQETSKPAGYNYAVCSCSSLSQYSSCMDLWCKPQVTQDVLPYMSYYCGLATGGSPTPPSIPAETSGAGANTAVRSEAESTGAVAETGTIGTSAAKPTGGAIAEPALSIGTGMITMFGILAIVL